MTSADDPLWVEPPEDGIHVFMLAAHARAYQVWLRGHGLHLFALPLGHDTTGYGVGVRVGGDS